MLSHLYLGQRPWRCNLSVLNEVAMLALNSLVCGAQSASATEVPEVLTYYEQLINTAHRTGPAACKIVSCAVPYTAQPHMLAYCGVFGAVV